MVARHVTRARPCSCSGQASCGSMRGAIREKIRDSRLQYPPPSPTRPRVSVRRAAWRRRPTAAARWRSAARPPPTPKRSSARCERSQQRTQTTPSARDPSAHPRRQYAEDYPAALAPGVRLAAVPPPPPLLRAGEGAVAVVTGGGSGIGRAVAERLAAGGWCEGQACLVLVGRRRAPLDEAAAACAERGAQVCCLHRAPGLWMAHLPYMAGARPADCPDPRGGGGRALRCDRRSLRQVRTVLRCAILPDLLHLPCMAGSTCSSITLAPTAPPHRWRRWRRRTGGACSTSI